MQVTDFFIYPLKSARGISLNQSMIELAGLTGDRHMLLVTPDGKFITQREVPKLATLQIEQSGPSLVFIVDGEELVRVLLSDAALRMDISIWRSEVNSAVASDDVNKALSDWLDREVKLVFFDDQANRNASEEWAGPNAPVRFADGYPVLITTTGSLAALNKDMAEHGEPPVTMDRFRPNIVLEQETPWAEDHWAAIEIAGIRLDLVKPCTRCIITTQDQQTGSREGATPMSAMQRTRMSADPRVGGVLFGWNAVPRKTGVIHVSDTVTVLEERRDGWSLKQSR